MNDPADPVDPVEPARGLDTADPTNSLDGLSGQIDRYADGPVDWETRRRLEEASVEELEAAARDAELQGLTDLSHRLEAEANSRRPAADYPGALDDATDPPRSPEVGDDEHRETTPTKEDSGETSEREASAASDDMDTTGSAALSGTTATWSGWGSSVLAGAVVGGGIGAIGGPSMALAGVALGAAMGWTAP
ncbi:hypothetical protein [Halarchaeum sp. P4]|uniref:hypothetical protein n=1 Tax=Halarchaeum sp. P4 TaxID=3421639 RepID=UPI003EC0741E